MCDHRRDVDAGFEQYAHLVPGFVHLPAVDALDMKHVEDHGLPIDGKLLRRNPEKRDPAAVKHVSYHVLECRRYSRHLKADIETLFHPELFLDVFQIFLFHIYRHVDVTHLLGELKAIWIHICDHDVARSGMASDRRSHDADRASTRDQNILAENLERESGVHRIPEWVKDRSDLKI